MGDYGIMKTTVELTDGLLVEAKEVAARDGTTLRALLESGLRAELATRRRTAGFRLRDEAFCGEGRGLRPELSSASWEEILEFAYEGRGT